METTHDGNLIDPSDRINRPPVPIDITVDDTDLEEAEALLAGLDSTEIEPAAWHEDEETLLQVVQRSRRLCWDTRGEGPAEVTTIAGHDWELWLDWAQTVETDRAGRPVAAFMIDRSLED